MKPKGKGKRKQKEKAGLYARTGITGFSRFFVWVFQT
jgi:hypothetical protein